ncbi:hypothetical protein ACTVCO_07595 [Sanguibacter sp. A247]|uniref:hypothetical protein n=1 Tax=unclassified Sanguibacter TaxID=2645534 RepID=UPI003FD75B7E
MEPLKVAALALAVLAAIAAAALAPRAFRQRTSLGMATVVAAVALLGGVGYVVGSGLGLWEKHTSVFVTALDDTAADFSFDVTHRRVYAGGDTYTFQPDASATELLAILKTAYPSGSTVDGGSRFTVIHAGTRFDVNATDDRTWAATRETVLLVDGNTTSLLAFPRDAVTGDTLQVGVATSLLLPAEAVRTELEALGAERGSDGTFTVSDTSGSRIRLTLTESSVTAAFASRVTSEAGAEEDTGH